MPFSNPSAFPYIGGGDQIISYNAGKSQSGSRVFLAGQNTGNFNKQSDLVLIGDSVAGTLTTGVTDTHFPGSAIVGSKSATNLSALGGTQSGPVQILGGLSATNVPQLSSTVIIGAYVLSALAASNANDGGNILLGNKVLAAVTTFGVNQFGRNIVIGLNAAGGVATPGGAFTDNIILGTYAVLNWTGSVIKNVCIGTSAGAALNATSNNVLVGHQAGDTLQTGTGNTLIGSQSQVATTAASSVTGVGVQQLLGGNSTALGANISQSGTGNILIGYNAGNTAGVVTNTLIVDTFDGVTQRAILYGDMTGGNLIIGKSVTGTNRDIPTNAANITKLLNGTKGSVNPIGGGYFYVNAGALHWVGSSGTDTQLATA